MNKTRHLFLWGWPQAGKTTLIRHILAAHPDWAVKGLRTHTVSTADHEEDSRVYIAPMQHCAWYKQEEALAGLRGPEGRRGNSQVFDKVGVRILQDFRNADLLIMDELGTMENKALAFQQAVLKALDRDTPILGVIKRDQTPFLEAVRHHPAVRTLEITPENRINRLAEADALVSRSVSAFRTSQSRPSCGAVVLRKKDGAWETLLINCRQGHWSFPKGHQEAGETEEDTARREILEETGLIVRIDPAFRRELPSIEINTNRQIVCFLAHYISGEAIPQENEIGAVAWVPLHEAPRMAAQHPQDAQVFLDAIAYLNKIGPPAGSPIDS
ncbi:MAG: nucleoside-triphosphatase [Christensenellales bacterium]|jgi:bis(5'-nucleosidyl)-tetraphosphatase